MSLKPGIGATFFQKYRSEIFPRDEVVIRGMKMKPPKYYDRLLAADPTTMSDDIEYSRYVRSLELLSDNTPDRLRVREIVTKARLNFKKRSIV